MQALFAAADVVAVALVLNGFMLYGVELLKRRSGADGPHDDARLAALSYPQAALIGVSQCLALIPGFSRTGAAMAGGLLSGLSHENAARYSFLLATPIIFAAAVLKVPDIFSFGGARGGRSLSPAHSVPRSARVLLGALPGSLFPRNRNHSGHSRFTASSPASSR